MRLRPHEVHVSLSHVAPAYLGEEYPISIEVTNMDSKELDVVADALLQPTEIEGASKSSMRELRKRTHHTGRQLPASVTIKKRGRI